HATVQVRGQGLVEAGAMRQHAGDKVLEVGQVRDFVRLLVGELGDHLLRVAAGNLPGVDRLQGATARAGAQDRIDAGAGTERTVHGRRSSRLTISSAAIAASSPLLPWLPPARASASSKRSTASTP